MDSIYVQPLVEMGVSLTELAVKGTASAVTKKIKAAREIKEVEKLRSTYDEIVNEILLEREEAVRIAQAYKSELDRIIISDEDILHLHNTVARLIEIVKTIEIAGALAKGDEEVRRVTQKVESYEQIKELISVDTLKTMQLLGFNYKAAIGEPLTQLCASAITSFGEKNRRNNTQNMSKKR